MCGFAVSLSPGADHNLNDALNSLRARGPDEDWQFEALPVSGAYTRLAMEGPPSMSATLELDGIVVLLNGEIWNYREVSASAGFHADSEVDAIRRLYRIDGLDFAKSLNGVFAVAVIDLRARRLVFARDLIGAKPLFFVRNVGGFCAASTLASLACVAGEERFTLNVNYLANYAAVGASPDSTTVLNDVEQVEAGSVLEVTYALSGQVTSFYQRRYVSDFEPPDTYCAADGNVDDHLLSLDAAVERTLRNRSSGRIGLLLSGGIDSTLLAALLRRHLDRSELLPIFLGQPTASDFAFATYVANALGLPLEVISGPLGHRPTALDTCGYGAFHLGAALARLKHLHPDVRVIMCGEGADELYGGYSSQVDPEATVKRMRQRIAAAPVMNEFLSGLDTAACEAEKEQQCREWMLSFERSDLLVGRHLMPFDFAAGFNGLEVRMPYLDLQHRSTAYQLGDADRMADGRTKPIVRDMLRLVAPNIADTVADRPKVALPEAVNGLLSAQPRIETDDDPDDGIEALGFPSRTLAWFREVVSEANAAANPRPTATMLV